MHDSACGTTLRLIEASRQDLHAGPGSGLSEEQLALLRTQPLADVADQSVANFVQGYQERAISALAIVASEGHGSLGEARQLFELNRRRARTCGIADESWS
ncbi:MAG TPA: hypothetical protein VFS24_16315 [Steroidobacteraceae bacterium]|nr:hypothetical protein [Steroidobacteraceae bacterium]